MKILQGRNTDVPVDLDQLERDVTEQLRAAPTARELQVPDPAYAPKKVPEAKRFTPLQVIGHAITRLTWMEAEKMGEDIQAKMSIGGVNTGSTSGAGSLGGGSTNAGNLTSAIQKWAEGWEAFNDENE